MSVWPNEQLRMFQGKSIVFTLLFIPNQNLCSSRIDSRFDVFILLFLIKKINVHRLGFE